MRKEDYLKRLSELLADIPADEREEALTYYAEYFEDAGEEESEVIKELGTPEEVAHNIREEALEKEIVPAVSVKSNLEKTEKTEKAEKADAGSQNKTATGKTDNNTLKIVLLILICVFFVPVGIPLLASAFGVILGVLSALFGIFVAVAACAAAFLAAGIIVCVVGITKLLIAPFAAIVMIGVGFVLLALSFLCMLATIKTCTVLIPGMIKGIGYIFKSIFKGKEVQAA